MLPITVDLRKKIGLRELPVGSIVITSKGFSFELANKIGNKETWKDLDSKLVWYPKEEDIFTHYQAVEKFNSKSKRLPTIKEFEEAESHGFREVLSDLNHWFWSASLYPSDTDFARGFYGNYGDSDVGVRDCGNSVRCCGDKV